MRLLLRLVFMAMVISLFGFALREGWIERAGSVVPAGTSMWPQGLWPLQDRLAELVRVRAEAARIQSGEALRVAARVDVSAVPRYRFSALSEGDLASLLSTATSGTGSVTVVPATGPSADLVVTLTLNSYVPGSNEDLLVGLVEYAAADGSRTNEPFEVRCPAHGRGWFVRPTRPPLWLLAAAVAIVVLGAGIAIWGASDAFRGDYEGTWRMFGSVLAMAVGAYLLAGFVCEPGLGSFGMPHRRVTLALEASDAVRFPPTPGAALPVAGQAGTNDVCRFMALCAERIGAAMEAPAGPAAGGFAAWLRQQSERVGSAGVESRLLSVSEGLDIVYSLPPAGSDRTNSTPLRASLETLPTLLAAGHRGEGPAFFLPWAAGSLTNRGELVVAFMTGEPASRSQAAWLRAHRPELVSGRPPAMRVLSVLLPSVPRADGDDWGYQARMRNAAAVSETVIALTGGEQPSVSGSGLSGEVEFMDVFKAPAVGEPGSADLDAARTRCFRADDGAMRQAAARIAERVRGLADVRRASVFRSPVLPVGLVVVMAACLALFLGLQRELRLLDEFQSTLGHLERTGALFLLAFSWATALALGYVVSEPARWRTTNGPAVVLWALSTVWYAGIWLPLLLGRSLGSLPRPERALKMTWLYAGFCLAMISLVLVALLAMVKCGKVMRQGLWLHAVPWVPAAAFVFFSFIYGYLCFHRLSRRRVFWSGYVCLLLLFVLPLGVRHVPRETILGVPLPCALALGVLIAAVAAPALFAMRAARRTTPVAKSHERGWTFLAGIPVAVALALLLYLPAPLGRCASWPQWPAWCGPAVLGVLVVLILGGWSWRVWREVRG